MPAPATCRRPRSRACGRCAAAWRWALVVATAATILLCINQQFSLRFFIGYTQLNTEYFYLLIALMLPFTFLIFPGQRDARRSTEFPGTTSCCSSPRSAAPSS